MSDSKGSVVLHSVPTDAHGALLLALLAQAHELGQKLGVAFPIHIVVEFGGKTGCGRVGTEEDA